MDDKIQPGFYIIVDEKTLRQGAYLPEAQTGALVQAYKVGHSLHIKTIADASGTRVHPQKMGHSGTFNGIAQNWTPEQLGLEAVATQDLPKDVLIHLSPLQRGLKPIGI